MFVALRAGETSLRELNFDVLKSGWRFGNLEVFVTHFFEMQFDCLANELHHFFTSIARSDAAREIRDVSAVACRAAFDHDGVAHNRLYLQSPLFENTVQCAAGQVNVRITCDGDESRFLRMFER